MNRFSRKVFIYFFYIIPIPLFLSVNGVYKGSSLDPDAFALPISLLVLLAVTLLNLDLLKILFHKHNFALLIFVLYSFFTYLLKIGFSGGSFNPNLLLVSILPFVLSYCIGYNSNNILKSVDIDIDIGKSINKSVVFLSLICTAHILSSFLSYGVIGAFINRGEDSIFGFFSIYQKFIYYPTILACYFILSLFVKNKNKLLFSSIILIDILIVASREAIVTCSIGFIFFLYFQLKKMHERSLINLVLISLLSITLISFYSKEIRNIYASATIVTKFQSLHESDDITAGRTWSMKKVFKNSQKDFNFLIGTGYSMNLGDFRSPHNQYAEILLRSGILGLIIFFLIIIITLKRIMLYIKYYGKTDLKNIIYGLSIVYICLISISFNINVPIRAPYTAIFVGYISGLFCNVESISKRLDE